MSEENELNTEDVVESTTSLNYKLPFNVAQALVDYLATKPYREVNGLIAAVMSLEEV